MAWVRNPKRAHDSASATAADRRVAHAARLGCNTRPDGTSTPRARMTPATASEEALATLVARSGHAFVPGAAMRPLLETHGALADWERFAQSWAHLPVDRYLADRGRYRRRRYAVYSLRPSGEIRRQPHQPHYQSRDYNPLYGGIERWFEPIEDQLDLGDSLPTVLRFAAGFFGRLAPQVARWHAEVHQFRIEAHPEAPGQPTPEGVHRDGVDYVLVLMVRRHNIDAGVTSIHAPDGTSLGSFTLADPCDAALIDDARVYHGVTPVVPLDATRPAHRDVLVVTLRRETSSAA